VIISISIVFIAITTVIVVVVVMVILVKISQHGHTKAMLVARTVTILRQFRGAVREHGVASTQSNMWRNGIELGASWFCAVLGHIAGVECKSTSSFESERAAIVVRWGFVVSVSAFTMLTAPATTSAIIVTVPGFVVVITPVRPLTVLVMVISFRMGLG
jgi:hypothetical protein